MDQDPEGRFYTPAGTLDWEVFKTMEQLSFEEAGERTYERWNPAIPGAYLRICVVPHDTHALPEETAGKRIVLNLCPGGESTVFMNGSAFGTYRADWVKQPHHFLVDNTLTWEAIPETYLRSAWRHATPAISTQKPRTADVPPVSSSRDVTGTSWLREPEGRWGEGTYGIWAEDAYQLFMDVETLSSLLKTLDDSLRAARVAEALEQFTLLVDLSRRRARSRDYWESPRHAGAGAFRCQWFHDAGIFRDWKRPPRSGMAVAHGGDLPEDGQEFCGTLRLMEEYKTKNLSRASRRVMKMPEILPGAVLRRSESGENGQWIAGRSHGWSRIRIWRAVRR